MSGTNIRKEFNKVIFLIFEKDISQPALCVMISRNNHCQEELVKEYENLKRLGQGVSEYLKKSIPLPLALEKIENYLVLFETAAPGVSLARLASSPRHFYDRKKLDGIFEMAKTWLVEFFENTKKLETHTSCTQKLSYLESIIDGYKQRFELSGQEKKGLDELLGEAEAVANSPVLFLPQHMHFWLGSIFIFGNSISVIDWKVYGKSSLPFFDMAAFLTSYGLKLKPADIAESFKMTFFENNWFSELIKKNISDYCLKTGIDIKFSRTLLTFYIIETANYVESICRADEEQYIKLWRDLFCQYLSEKDKFIIG